MSREIKNFLGGHMDKGELMSVLEPVVGLSMADVSNEASIVDMASGELMVRANGSEHLVVDRARKRLLSHIKVSGSLVDRLHVNTASNLLTELYQDGDGMSVLVNSDGVMLDFVDQKGYKSVGIPDMLEAVEEVLGSDVEFNRAFVLPNYDVRLEIVGAEEVAVNAGDLIRAGVCIQFSPVGITNPTIQTFGVRLVCTNGMIGTTVFDNYELGLDFTGSNDDMFNWIKSTTDEAYSSIHQTAAQLRVLSEQPVSATDRPQLIASLANQARLRGRDASALWAQATEYPPETAYDVLNLMTWLSSHVLEDPKRVIRAQDASAGFVDQVYHRRFCPTCQRES